MTSITWTRRGRATVAITPAGKYRISEAQYGGWNVWDDSYMTGPLFVTQTFERAQELAEQDIAKKIAKMEGTST